MGPWNRLEIVSYLQLNPRTINPRWLQVCETGGIYFQAYPADVSSYFPRSECRPVFRTSINSPFLFWGYCLDLLSQADKGIHLAANPFLDLDQVSEAHPFTSKYLSRLISKILPA